MSGYSITYLSPCCRVPITIRNAMAKIFFLIDLTLPDEESHTALENLVENRRLDGRGGWR